MRHWLVFVGDNPAAQLNKWVICPNWRRLEGVDEHPHWRHVPDDIREGDRIWFFERGRGIDTLCEVSGPLTDDQPHAAFPDEFALAYHWPTKVVARFALLPPREFGRLYHPLNDGTGDVPVSAEGRFTPMTYCHRLPGPVARAIAERADGGRPPPRVLPGFRTVLEAAGLSATA